MKKIQSHLSEEDEMLFDSQGIEKDVVLRTKSKAAPNVGDVLADVKAVDDGRSACWRKEACQYI